jgi:hypothetical protein
MDCYILSPAEKVVEEFKSVLVAADHGFVPDTELFARFGGPLVIAKQDDLDFGVQQCPTLEGIPLNYSGMALEWFRSCEDR